MCCFLLILNPSPPNAVGRSLPQRFTVIFTLIVIPMLTHTSTKLIVRLLATLNQYSAATLVYHWFQNWGWHMICCRLLTSFVFVSVIDPLHSSLSFVGVQIKTVYNECGNSNTWAGQPSDLSSLTLSRSRSTQTHSSNVNCRELAFVSLRGFVNTVMEYCEGPVVKVFPGTHHSAVLSNSL